MANNKAASRSGRKTKTAAGVAEKRKRSKAPGKTRASAKKPEPARRILSSTLSYEGPLFRVYTDEIRENNRVFQRDVIRHHGSVVILAIDDPAKRDPLVVVERQYRHAAKQYLLELPAGTLESGEDPMKGAKRELLEETGFTARRWRKLVHFFASPGFLGEWMQVFVAEGLVPGQAEPEEDEQIDVDMLPLSEILRKAEKGEIHDGKTLISVMLYDRLRRQVKNPGASSRPRGLSLQTNRPLRASVQRKRVGSPQPQSARRKVEKASDGIQR